ncbi:MAG: YchJ family protein [Spirochaetales bacterium]
MSETDKFCPCGTGKSYADCCGPVITGTQKALTAESLMRARYSAYVKHEIDFIISTCVSDDNAKTSVDKEQTRKWSEESTWLGLKIIKTEKGGENDKEGSVEFTATYSQKGLKDVHKEKAFFVKQGDDWLYRSGNVTPVTVVREGEKVGRNAPCPCNSGKKYKHCCGA